MVTNTVIKIFLFICLATLCLAATCSVTPITEDVEPVENEPVEQSSTPDTSPPQANNTRTTPYPTYMGSMYISRADTGAIIIDHIVANGKLLKDATIRLLRPIQKEADKIYAEYTVKKGTVYGIHEEKRINITNEQGTSPIIFDGQGLNAYPTGGGGSNYPLKEGTYAFEIAIYNKELATHYKGIIGIIDLPAQSTITPTKFNAYRFALKYPVPLPSQYSEICPLCNQKDQLIPVMYGMPNEEGMKEAEEGKVWLGGCVIGAFMYSAYCKRDSILIE